MKRWGIVPERIGDDRSRLDDHRSLDTGEANVRRVRRNESADQRGFLMEGGWGVATLTEGGGRSGGLTTHRGVLHPDEYVNEADLRARISEHLGFTVDEVRSVYRQGPLSAAGRELRARIDARLLEVSESGGNVLELCRALGFPVREREADCQTAKSALRRARQAREENR